MGYIYSLPPEMFPRYRGKRIVKMPVNKKIIFSE